MTADEIRREKFESDNGQWESARWLQEIAAQLADLNETLKTLKEEKPYFMGYIDTEEGKRYISDYSLLGDENEKQVVHTELDIAINNFIVKLKILNKKYPSVCLTDSSVRDSISQYIFKAMSCL